MIANCVIDGTVDCSISTIVNGIVSYATTSTNIIQNNVVTDCNIGFVTPQPGTFDIITLNNAYKNNTQYSSNIVGLASICGCLSISGENITVVGQAPSITSPGVYALCGNLTSVAIQSSNVTLDLSNYNITNGIILANGVNNVTVANGSIGPITGTINADGILTGSCQNCIFQNLQISNCLNGIHMVDTSNTPQSNNQIINCSCTYNTQNGILLNQMNGTTLQNCTCSYNFINTYTGGSTVQNIALVCGGIMMTNVQYTIVDGCVCNNNAYNCFSNNIGAASSGLAGVMNCTVTGGGIYLVSSGNNTIQNCVCNNNATSLMCSNTGGSGPSLYGGGAGVGGNTGGIGATNATCGIYYAGIFLNNSFNNNMQACECNNNNAGNMCYNTGGTGGSAYYNTGGGAGVGGGGASNSANGASATCLTTGGGIYIYGQFSTDNIINGCTCNTNNTGNFANNTGGGSGSGTVVVKNSTGQAVGNGGDSARCILVVLATLIQMVLEYFWSMPVAPW